MGNDILLFMTDRQRSGRVGHTDRLRAARLYMDDITDHCPTAQLTWAIACAADRRSS